MADDGPHHPSALRNREPIWEKLAAILKEQFDYDAQLGASGEGASTSAENTMPRLRFLEVASGTGAHVELFCRRTQDIMYQQSEKDEAMRSRIVRNEGALNVLEPIVLDLEDPAQIAAFGKMDGSAYTVHDFLGIDVLYACNVCHISPFQATRNLFQELAKRILLKRGSLLVIYGPFKRDGKFTTESNEAFDANLRARNAEWGYRDISELEAVAQAVGLQLLATYDMPANNFMLLFRKEKE
eukprot:TRINITY_DN103071_c0_g1_i1.p1 TRINITY_DN103071_c0_g1~~TRINITY_DN103071_c0_g1_i1.p1  ORF type:complete len:241 (-),score=55.57 TRINITY_DN103071_c0_g1_i1:218-940(-)